MLGLAHSPPPCLEDRLRRTCKTPEVQLEEPYIQDEDPFSQCYKTSPILEYPCTSLLPLQRVDGRGGFSGLHAMLNEHQPSSHKCPREDMLATMRLGHSIGELEDGKRRSKESIWAGSRS